MPASPEATHPPGHDAPQANTETCYEVTREDLPLSCPMKGTTLWNSHPRVYLPIEASGRIRCPYCGAEYVLKG
ncbi:MAG TPA: zinc-finger domain-containing protein [Thiotrichales bacterium]|nr:zinc-finger domain-containing protein [Thiotrichales bacterium]